MGDLRFKCSKLDEFDSRVWNTAFITGIEGIPWQCHQTLEGTQFRIGREIDESGKLNIVWPTSKCGQLCLSTTSLRITDAPYQLPVELARGCVGRLKQQTDEWQRVGLRLPEEFFPCAENALEHLLKAITSCASEESAAQFAQRSIDAAVEASVVLCDTFSGQALEARRNSEGRLATLLGITFGKSENLDPSKELISKCFNLNCISADLGAVETSSAKKDYSQFDQQVGWSQELDSKICMGPLVNFLPGGLPQWMSLLGEGFDSILTSACDHVRETVTRYKGRVHIWNCAAGLNSPNGLGWNDEQILRMAVSLIETVRQTDDRTPVLLTVNQPWSEYLRDDSQGISPLHFADALIRADLGLSGLSLRLDFANWPHGSMPRDPIELSRLVDRWSMLGLPLMAHVTTPRPVDDETDYRWGEDWSMPYSSAGCVSSSTIVNLLACKPSIHAVIWDGNDGVRPDFGLLNQHGKPLPIANNLARIKANYLH